jgi:cell shape-determining protein MreC
VVAGTSVFATSLFIKKPHFLFGDIQAMWSGSSRESHEQLVKENEDLKNKIYASEHAIIVRDQALQPVKIFSLYPFNTKNRVFIDAGNDLSIQKGAIAFFSSRVFFGVVVGVSANTAEVQTIFDSALEVPVRIGPQEVNGLLQGGVIPKIILIDKTKSVHSQDSVVTSAKNMPYGLTVGTIREVHEDTLGTFFEATIDTPYVINEVRNIFIERT